MLKDKSIGIIPFFRTRNGYKFLVIQQVFGDWIFPKGHLISGETDIQTAIRELYEETNIDNCTIINGFKYVLKYSFEKQGEKTEKEVVFFLGLVKDIDALTKTSIKNSKGEVINLKWLSYKSTLEQLTHKNQREMLKKVFEYLETHSSELGNFVGYEKKSISK